MYALMATMQTKFKDVIHRRHRIQLPGPHEVVSACTPSTHTKDSRPLGLTLPDSTTLPILYLDTRIKPM